jgi:hypothetical protein
MISDDALEHLRTAFAGGRAMLFTGAGFSAAARDAEGAALPLGEAMARELGALCFGDDCDDDSSLQDLYDVATEHHRADLIDYLKKRLVIGEHALPEHYGLWFAAPWARCYTLNVDELEGAVARQFALPRPIRAISAVPCDPKAPALPPPPRDVLEVVHLNGIVGDELDTVTFSTLQYATRLVEGCPHYAALTADLDACPFVFVGTVLDEALFWQHLQLRRARHAERGERDDARPRSFLVTPSLSRARRVLLEGLHIEWVPGTAEEFADGALRMLVAAPRRRFARDPVREVG